LSVITEADALRRELKSYAADPDWSLLTSYDLLSRKPPSTLRERGWRMLRYLLASIKLVSPHVTQYLWLPTLKHRPVSTDVETMLIWAIGADRDQLRAACKGFSEKIQGNDNLAPVLITDVADFAFYSRLGWLVEYLPTLSGPGPSLKQRKQSYLAWRYRDACIVPWMAGLASDPEWQALLELS
jgi:hypothetical protein